jgi:hypothetical protein
MTTTDRAKIRQMQGIAAASVLLILILLGWTFYKERQRNKVVVKPIEPILVENKVYTQVISDLNQKIADQKSLIASWDDNRDTIRLLGATIYKNVYLSPDTFAGEVVNELRTRLLWFNAQVDDTIVQMGLTKLINFRLVQNYICRGELKICDIQALHYKNIIEDYQNVVYYDSLQIGVLMLAEKTNSEAYRQCKEISDKQVKELKKETKAKNIWRVSALISGMVAALFIVK